MSEWKIPIIPSREDYAAGFIKFYGASHIIETVLDDIGLGDDWESQGQSKPLWGLGERLKCLIELSDDKWDAVVCFHRFDTLIQEYAAGQTHKLAHKNVGTIIGRTAHAAAADLLIKLYQTLNERLQPVDPEIVEELLKKPWDDCGAAGQELLRDVEMQFVDGSREPFQLLAGYLSNERSRLSQNAKWLNGGKNSSEEKDDEVSENANPPEPSFLGLRITNREARIVSRDGYTITATFTDALFELFDAMLSAGDAGLTDARAREIAGSKDILRKRRQLVNGTLKSLDVKCDSSNRLVDQRPDD